MCPSGPGAGVELVYEERGAGPPVVLIHDRGSDHLALEPLASALEDEARVIAYARRGYAGSGAPEPYAGTTVHEQAEDAARLLGHLGAARAIAVGDGFGALVALDLLLRRPELIPGAVLVDPPLYAFVPDAVRELADERAELEEAVAAGGPAAGVERHLAGRADAAQLERATSAAPAFFADYAGLATLPLTRRELRALGSPVVIVTGPRTGATVAAAADALSALVTAARRTRDGDVEAAVRSLLGS